jgi:hypothetical protein
MKATAVAVITIMVFLKIQAKSYCDICKNHTMCIYLVIASCMQLLKITFKENVIMHFCSFARIYKPTSVHSPLSLICQILSHSFSLSLHLFLLMYKQMFHMQFLHIFMIYLHINSSCFIGYFDQMES